MDVRHLSSIFTWPARVSLSLLLVVGLLTSWVWLTPQSQTAVRAADTTACQSVTLEGPQTVEVGQTLDLSASASCGGSANYAFFSRTSDAQSWTLVQGWGGATLSLSVGNNWALGAEQYLVWATDGSLTTPQVQTAQTVVVSYPGECSSVTLTTQPSPSGYLGSSIDLAAAATCDQTASYAFFASPGPGSPWTLVRGWGGPDFTFTSDFSWSDSDFQFLVWASDGPQTVPQVQAQASLSVNAPAACSAVSLTPSTIYPGADQALSVTASGTCPVGSNVEYSYFVRPLGGSWTLMSAWTGSSWSWTTPSTSGDYQILAWASDGPYTDPQAQELSTIYVNEPPPCTSLAVAASPSTVTYGNDVTISASSQCPAGQAEYSYFVGTSASGPWTLQDAWTGSSWNWNPGQVNPGTYYLLVWVSDGPYSTPQLQQTTTVNVDDPPACTAVSAGTSPSGTVAVGSTVSVTASATCPDGSVTEYSYFTSASSSGPWTLQQAWTGSSWNWDTAGSAPGNQYILVWASNGPYTSPQVQTVVSASLSGPPPHAGANPQGDINPTYSATCYQSGYTSTACETAELQNLNSARAQEGLGPLSWNAQLIALPQAEQLFIEANQERVSRGLPAIPGMDPQADSNAMAGSQANGDPNPGAIAGTLAYMGDWAEDYGALGASFDWMYNDGLGSGNIDCTAAHQGGCWGHRENILLNTSSGEFAAPGGYSWVAGAACMPESSAPYFNSCSLEFVLLPDSSISYQFTWAEAVSLGA